MPPSLLDRYQKVKDRMATSAAKTKRSLDEITLVAVTKNGTPEQIKSLIERGHYHFGESRVLQLQQRAAQIHEWLARIAKSGPAPAKVDKKNPPLPPLPPPDGIAWHMIGHLQRNKVKPLLPLVKFIHSVDSLRLAEEIQNGGAKMDRTLQVLLEVNVAGESSKSGVAVGAALHLAEQIDTMDGLQLIGLMAMAPHSEDPEDARPHFVRLREIFEEIRFRKIGGPGFKHLSMGMSGDYQVAIEEGATMVRIGTAIFG